MKQTTRGVSFLPGKILRTWYNRKTIEPSYALVLPFMAILIAGVVLPLCVITLASISSPQEWGGVQWGSFNVSAYIRIFFEQDLDGSWAPNTGFAIVVVRTLLLSGIATLICLLLGFPAALYIAMQPAQRRTWLILLITVPFWTSLVVRLYAWILLLRDGGVLSSALARVSGLNIPSVLYTDTATVIGLAYAFIPFMVIPIFTSLEHMTWDIVDAAFDLGATPFIVIARIVMPLASRGILSGCVLVMVSSLGAYLIPDLLGGAKSMMLGNLVNLQFGDAHDWPLGAALSLVTCVLVLLALRARRMIERGVAGVRHV